jgi:hypothetical protein
MMNDRPLTPTETVPLIFDDLYMIRVPSFATKSDLELRLFGTVYTGNPDVDKGHLDEIVTVMWSINRMVESYKKGIPIRVINPQDTKKIFESISKHLEAWKNYKEYGININRVPYDDLVKLDEFASSVYEHVKFEYSAIVKEETSLDRYLKELNLLNEQSLSSILEQPKKESVKTWREEDIKKIPERYSYGEYFKNSYNGNRRR